MSTKTAIVLFISWVLIGLCIAFTCAWTIRDFMWYGLCCDGRHLLRLIVSAIALALYFITICITCFIKPKKER